MNDAEKIAQVRAQMPVTTERVYLNTGTAGPIAQVTQDAFTQASQFEFETGRGTVSSFLPLMDDITRLRGQLADLLGASRSEVAITHHTTEGINIIAHGLRWQPGDEIVTTSAEHEGGLLPLYVIHQRHGVTIKVVPVDVEDSAEAVIAKLAAAIGPRTRLLAFSHVFWNSGLRLPLEPIAEMARSRNVLTLVDGAQSAGAVPLELGASGVDFYALPGQKWLCGPEGIGALFVRAASLAYLEPTFVGFFSLPDASAYDLSGYFVPAPGAARFEVGTVYRPGIKAMVANLDWLANTVGWSWVHGRIAHLTEAARGMLKQIPEVTMVSREDSGSGLLSFKFGDADPTRVVAKMEELGVVLRSLGDPSCLRISLGFFNTEADIERLRSALGEVAAMDPESLPPPIF